MAEWAPLSAASGPFSLELHPLTPPHPHPHPVLTEDEGVTPAWKEKTRGGHQKPRQPFLGFPKIPHEKPTLSAKSSTLAVEMRSMAFSSRAYMFSRMILNMAPKHTMD